jgi:Na+/H+ antiporter NhaD/arsenite permease-like protein
MELLSNITTTIPSPQGGFGKHIDGEDYENQCKDGNAAPLYVQILGTVIFVGVWPFIVLDMKWFPLGRPAAALVGAGLMIICHVVIQEEQYWIQGELGNMRTIFLLVGMMMISYYFDREGILRLLSLYIFGDRKPFKHILWKVCLLSAFMSALITNDATCLVITPLLLLEFQKQGRHKRELLPLCLGIATSANIGSAATLFGNPQNAFIASAAGVSLLEFFMALLPAALIGTAVGIVLLYLFFWRTVLEKYDTSIDNVEVDPGYGYDTNRNYAVPGTLAEERESVALSYDQSNDPYLSSRIAAERDRLYSHERDAQSGSYQRLPNTRSHGRGTSPYPYSKQPHLKPPDIRVENNESQPIVQNGGRKKHLPDVSESVEGKEDAYDITRVKSLKERTWRERIFIIWLCFATFLVIALLAIPPPPVVSFQFDLGLMPVAAGIFTMLADTILNKTYAHDAMLKIDWTVILMFMGLFVWLGGFQNTCYPEMAFNKLAPYMNLNKIEGVLLFTVAVIIGSNIFSNVPLVILIVDRIGSLCGEEECKGPLGGLLLAWISTIAGNFTLIGSVANLIVAEKARGTVGYRITFWNYFKFGGISTCVVLFGMLPIVYFVGKLA